MLRLEFYREEDFHFLNYQLDKVQTLYTASVDIAIKRIHERVDGKAFPITIFVDSQPVGFFVLDFGDDKLELTENDDAVLLRSLSINPEFQGKGIGGNAMLYVDLFVKKNFPSCNEIVLAVNQKNIHAYNIYKKTGYVDLLKTRMGRSGLQYLMSKEI